MVNISTSFLNVFLQPVFSVSGQIDRPFVHHMGQYVRVLGYVLVYISCVLVYVSHVPVNVCHVHSRTYVPLSDLC